jgi:hypothetical protein
MFLAKAKTNNFFKICLLFRNRAGELVVARNYTSRLVKLPIEAGTGPLN